MFGRARSLEPQPLRDVERGADGRWKVQGPRPLVALILEGPVPAGDVRLELELRSVEAPVRAALVLDTGAGFERGLEVPLPVGPAGRIVTVTTLPNGTAALGLDPGLVGTFQFGALRMLELSGIGAVLAHAVPQMRRLLRDPQQLVPLLARAVRLFRYRGAGGVVERLRRGTQRELAQEGYEGWLGRYGAPTEEQREQLSARLAGLRKTTFSLLLASGEGPESELRRTFEALEQQVYPHWELCLDDNQASESLREMVRGSISPTRVRWTRGGDALAAATGDFVARLEPGDALSSDALFAVAEAIGERPEVALIYTDSDGEDATGRLAPAFKPEWSPEFLRSWNYVGRAAYFRTDRTRELGGWRSGSGDVAQHELLLRYTIGLASKHISHLPVVLLRNRAERAPTSQESLAGAVVVQESLARAGATARVEPGRRPGTYHVHYALPNPSPLVTVVIPTRDRLALLSRCIQSVKELTAYRPLEIVIVDNDSRNEETRACLQELERRGTARVLRYLHPFNFSAMNNLAANAAGGELLCLLNNDVEAFDAGWLTEMVGLALQPGVGAVGAKLLYPDKTVQHAGIVAGLFGAAAHNYVRAPREADGYLQQLQTTREVAAVTAACMVVRRDRFLEVEGFDEAELAVAFNDVDFCFKLLKAGYRNLWTPYAELYHRESASRGNDERGADRQRFLREESVMRERWAKLIDSDPSYSPNLSLDSNAPTPAWPPRYVAPWIAVG